jgi:hypothetical protein
MEDQDISSKTHNNHKSSIRVKIFKGSNIPDLEKQINLWLEINIGIEIIQTNFQRCMDISVTPKPPSVDCAVIVYKTK